MKFKVGDKIKYRDFLVERNHELWGEFIVDQVADGKHGGCNLIRSIGMPLGSLAGNRRDCLVCSADFELVE